MDRIFLYERKDISSILIFGTIKGVIKMKNFDKSMLKKSPEELELYMHFKNRESRIKAKKGKGSFSRKEKHKGKSYDY